MLRYLRTKHIGPASEFELADLGQRLNVLTGDNGLGKTLLLDIAWWVCARDWPEGPAIPRRFILPMEGRTSRPVRDDGEIAAVTEGRTGKKTTQTFTFDPKIADWRRRGKTRPPIPGLVIYARIDGGFSVWDPARHYYRVAPSLAIDDPDRPPAFHFSKEEVWAGKRMKDALKGEVTVCEGLARDWLEWETREPDLFAVFKAVLNHLSPPGEEIRPAASPVRLPGPDVTSLPALDTAYGVVPLQHASAAVRRVISLAYFLVWTWHQHELQSAVIGSEPERRVIIIIDEVEGHLHPKWQRRLMPALLTVARLLNADADAEVQFIVSTHSPLVLASLEPAFDEQRDRLFHLALNDGTVRLEPKVWENHGDVSGWLTSDIFALGEARSQPAEDAIEAAQRFMRGTPDLPPGLDTVEAIDQALRGVLPSLDPVWAQWHVFKQRRAGAGRGRQP